MTKFLLEIKDFIKNNLKFILVGTLILTILYGAFTFYDNTRNSEVTEELEEEQLAEDFEELYSDGAYFNFFVENPDGSVFNNTSIIEQYILMEDSLIEASRETGIDIYELFQEERESAFQRTSDNRGVLGVSRNQYSNRLSLIVQTPNQEDNLVLAEYYHELFTNDLVPVLSTKEVYIFETPRELDSVLVSEEVMEKVDNIRTLTIVDLIQNTLLSFVFGLILFSIIAFVKELFSKKITYSFSYFRDEADQFEIKDKRLNNEDEITHMLSVPKALERVVLSEKNVSSYADKEIFENLRINADSIQACNNLAGFTSSSKTQEFVLLIVSGKTSRSWYRKQRKFMNSYNVPVKILQINE